MMFQLEYGRYRLFFVLGMMVLRGSFSELSLREGIRR
jgi:hypothetical protein